MHFGSVITVMMCGCQYEKFARYLTPSARQPLYYNLSGKLKNTVLVFIHRWARGGSRGSTPQNFFPYVVKRSETPLKLFYRGGVVPICLHRLRMAHIAEVFKSVCWGLSDLLVGKLIPWALFWNAYWGRTPPKWMMRRFRGCGVWFSMQTKE